MNFIFPAYIERTQELCWYTLVSCLAKYSRVYVYRLDRSFHGSAWPCYCGYAEIKRFLSISSMCLLLVIGVTITPFSGMTKSAVSFITSSRKITTVQSQSQYAALVSGLFGSSHRPTGHPRRTGGGFCLQKS